MGIKNWIKKHHTLFCWLVFILATFLAQVWKPLALIALYPLWYALVWVARHWAPGKGIIGVAYDRQRDKELAKQIAREIKNIEQEQQNDDKI